MPSSCARSPARPPSAWAQRAIFSPILDPAGVGNGVHIHMSFQRFRGEARDARFRRGPMAWRRPARAFMAGVLKHLPALCAVTAPSTISYIRLTPNRWAPTFAYIADRDREASLRICPVLTIAGSDPDRQFNVEYRPADAAASPYLALGAVVHAGVEGIRHELELPAAPRRRPHERGGARGGRHPAPAAFAGRSARSAGGDATRLGPGSGRSSSMPICAINGPRSAPWRGSIEAAQCARYALTY